MKFQYYLPPEEESKKVDTRFLPSLAFTVLSRNGIDTEHYRLQGIFTRRIPQIIKIKADTLKFFKTNLIIPVGKDRIPSYYVEIESDTFWSDPSFISGIEHFDYLLGGSVSLDREDLHIQVYSQTENEIIYDRAFRGGVEDFFKFTTDCIKDLLHFFEYVPTPEQIEALNNRPVKNRESFSYLIEALESDPRNNVESSSLTKYVENLKKSLELDPQSSDVSTLLVSTAEQMLREDRAMVADRIIEFVLALKPLDRTANLTKTRILIMEGFLEEALGRLDYAARKGAPVKDIPYILARDLTETTYLDEAERLYVKALEIGYDAPELYDSYAYLLIHRRQNERALKILERGLQKYPDRLHTLIQSAQLLAEMGQFQRANDLYARAYTQNPGSPKALASRAIYYAFTGESDKAREYINTALDISPEDPLINMEGAKIFNFIGLQEDAERLARTAIDLQPRTHLANEAKFLLSRISSKLTEEDQMRNRELYIKAVRLISAGKNEEAIKILDRITSSEPLFWNAWFLKGVVYRRLGRIDDALDSFENVEDLFSDQISFHHEMARCLMEKERFTDAFPHMLYAFQKRPEDPIIMANMGLIYLFLNRIEEADMLLSQAKMMDPGNTNFDPYIERLRVLKSQRVAGRDDSGQFEFGSNGRMEMGPDDFEDQDDSGGLGLI